MSIHYKYQFNDSDYAEIHHGERFHLDYSFSNVKYLILFHKRPVSLKQSSPKDKKINWPIGSFLNWIKITKPRGRFESVANAYEPDIVFYCFKFKIIIPPSRKIRERNSATCILLSLKKKLYNSRFNFFNCLALELNSRAHSRLSIDI